MSYAPDKWTDKELEALEKRIAKVYKEAEKELSKEVNEYFAKFKIRDKEMKALVDAGEMSNADYMKWRTTQMGRGQRFEALRDKVAERYTKANEVANAYVNDKTPSIYSLNRNYEAYQIEKAVGSCDFTMWDESTVRRLIVEEPDLMPYYPPSRALQRGIDLAYGKDQITKRVTSGIIRGLAPSKIATELMQGITTMNRESAVRAARTGITAAQNAGRLDSWVAAEKMGIKIRRRWICTKDARTRTGHAMADGQVVEGTKTPFVVDGEKMMFPGDKSLGAHGWNIYNCRCSTRTVEKDGIEAEPREMRVRDADGKWQVVNEMTYSEWVEWKNGSVLPVENVIAQRRTVAINNMRNKAIWNGLPEERREALLDAIKNGDIALIENAERCMENCSVNWDGDKSYYRRGTGHIEIASKDNDKELARTFWHEYGHFMDDAGTSGSGFGYTYRYPNGTSYFADGVTVIVDETGYKNAAYSDLKRMLNKLGLSDDYDVRMPTEYYSQWIIKKATGDALDTDVDFDDMFRLEQKLADYFDEKSGLKKANNYLHDMGYPKTPNWNDYFETYTTPKRQTVKTRPKYKGAEEAWQKAQEENWKARELFESTHDMDALIEEQRRLKELAEAKHDLFGAVSDTFDGLSFGAFRSSLRIGGHDPSYYQTSFGNIKEGVANVYQQIMMNDPDLETLFQEVCPDTYKLIKEGWKYHE